MTRITDERLKELLDHYSPDLCFGVLAKDTASALDELIERRAAPARPDVAARLQEMMDLYEDKLPVGAVYRIDSAIDDLSAPGAEAAAPCEIAMFSSRACERGTRGCTVEHSVVAHEPPPNEQQAGLLVADEPQASSVDRRGVVKMVTNMLRRDNTPSRNEAANLLESAFEPEPEAPAVPAGPKMTAAGIGDECSKWPKCGCPHQYECISRDPRARRK